MRGLFHGKTKATSVSKCRKALKENGFTFNKSTKTWIRGGGFFNIEEVKIRTSDPAPGSPNFWLTFIVPA